MPTAPGADRTSASALLRVRNYRRFLLSQLTGTSSTWMQRIAQDWLVLELTGSASAVGVAVALQFLPMLAVGPFFGVLVDRYDKRRLLVAAQTVAAGLALGLAGLVMAGAVAVWHVFAVAAALGLVTAVAQPARQVLVAEVVGDHQLRNAVSINNAVGQGSGLLGPAAAGALIQSAGQGWAFVATAALAVLSSVLLGTMRGEEMAALPRLARARGQVRAGFAHVLANPELRWILLLAGALGMFGMNGPVVLAAFAEGTWGTGAGGFGLYNSLSAAGALVGALLSTRLPRLTPRTVVLAAAAFGLVETVTAVMPNEVAFMVMLVVVGAATLTFLTTAATFVQLAADPAVRGRVMAIYTPVLMGGHALGGLLAGWLTDTIGVRGGLVVVGVGAVVSAALVALALARDTTAPGTPARAS